MTDEVAIIDAPSAGAESTADISSPSPSAEPSAPASIDYAKMSDADILNSTGSPPDSESPDPAQPEAAQPTAEPEKAVDPNQPIEAKLAEDGRVIPEKYRELFKGDPELRGMFFRDRANSLKLTELQTKLPELERVAQEASQTDEHFFSGDPARQIPVLEGMAKTNPDAFLSAIRVSDQVLQKLDPAKFATLSAERLKAGLSQQSFEPFLQSLREAKAAGNGDLVNQLVDELVDWGQKVGFAATPEQALKNREKQLSDREASLKHDEQQQLDTRVSAFKNDANKRIDDALKTSISSKLDLALKGSAFEKSEGARTRIAAEIDSQVRALWSSSEDLHKQVLAVVPQDTRQWSDQVRDRQVETVSKFNTSVIDGISKKVIDAYTKDFLASHNARQEKVAAAATRKDVSGGTPQPNPARPLTPKDVDYRKMSDRQILEM